MRSWTTRYRKLTVSLIIVLALWGVSVLQQITSTCGSPGPATVSIVQTPSYPVADATLEAMVRDAVAKAGGLESVISPGDVVVVKPNLVETTWASGSGVVTDIRVVRTVVQMAQEAGASEVIIAEGTAGYRYGEGNDRFCTSKAFADSGLDENRDMIDDVTGAQLYDLNLTGGTDVADPDYVTLVDLPTGLLRQEYYVPNILLDCDVLISVPILKNHGQAGVTGSMKNRVGCAPNDLYHAPGSIFMKSGLVHWNSPYGENETVARALVDLNRVRPADFTVMDALIGITNGPTGTDKPSPYIRCVMAGTDSTAVDTVETLIMAYDPDHIRQILHCRSIGFGQSDTSLITVIGKSVSEVRSLDFPANYGESVLVELDPPTLGDMTPPDGSVVSGTVDVTLSGVGDVVGVVKAELYVDDELYAIDRIAPYSFTWDSTSVEDGVHVLKAKVYDAALNEASVTHTITVQHSWMVELTGATDGASDVFEFGCKAGASDSVDAYDVQETFASPYLSLATLMDSAYYSTDCKSLMNGMPGTREWRVYLTSDLNPTPSTVTLDWSGIDWRLLPPIELELVDHGTSWETTTAVYNMRDVNSATLNISGTSLLRYLTVRAISGSLGTISHAKSMPNGETIYLAGKIVTAGNDEFANNFYISDPDGSSGIRVSHSTGTVHTVREGDTVNVQGTLTTVYGERAIIQPTVTTISTGSPVPEAKGMANRSVGGGSFGPYVPGVAGSSGPNNVGQVVLIWGRVTYADPVTKIFYVDDGSNRQDGTGHLGIRIHCGGRVAGSTLTLPSTDDHVKVSGISAASVSGSSIISIIRPRKQTDIVVLY